MKYKIIENETEYNQALERFEEIFGAKTGSEEYEEMRVLALFNKNYHN